MVIKAAQPQNDCSFLVAKAWKKARILYLLVLFLHSQDFPIGERAPPGNVWYGSSLLFVDCLLMCSQASFASIWRDFTGYEHSDCAFISFSFQCQIVSVDVSFCFDLCFFCLSEYVSSAVEGPRFLAFFGVQAKEGGPFQLHGCAARFLVLFLVVFFKKDFSMFLTSSHTSFPNQKATPKKLEELCTKRGRHLTRNQSERLLEKMQRNSTPTCMKHHENMLEIKRKNTLRF